MNMPSSQLYFSNDEVSSSNVLEKHVLNTSEGIIRFNVGKNVVLTIEGGGGLESRERDSSRVHTHVLSEYKWNNEEGYAGRVLAVHGSLIAYRLFNDSTGESVRILDKESGNRHLIKGFMYPTADLQWASHAPLLAVLDHNANLYVYHVGPSCVVNKYLNVMRPENAVPPDAIPKLTWCPFIPESDEPRELIHMVAIYFGNVVELITLNAIKIELENEEEVSIERLDGIPESLIRLPKEDMISDARMVCMSPDATAVAVIQDSPTGIRWGLVSFFIISPEGARFAHRWQPRSTWPIHDLIFLDNTDVNSETSEQFWKYAIVAIEDGRCLELYESENWHCIGRLCFESVDLLPTFSVSIDPSARFLFLADYGAANVYCVEMIYTDGVPRFAACTQISFCHPLVYIVPYSITTNEWTRETVLDASLFDEEPPLPSVNAWLIALSQRSLLELEFYLDSANIDSDGKKSECKVSVAGDMNNSGKESEAMEKISHKLDKEGELMEAVNAKLEKVLQQMEHQTQKAEKQRREDQNKIEGLIQQLKEEMSMRDERLLLKFSSVICDNRSATVEAIQNSIDMKMDSFVERLQLHSKETDEAKQKALNEELAKSIRSSMMSVVVPALDSVCSSLFQQLTETFRTGLEQFLRQVRNVQLETAKVSGSVIGNSTNVDGSTLIQLIENDQISTAFERALSQNDVTSLMFVCNKVDPDTLFRDEPVLPQTILLCILKKLGGKLEGETDLKFRYIENSLMALNLKDPTTAANYRPVLEFLQEGFLNFMAKDANSSYKRQTRIILQLIVNMLR